MADQTTTQSKYKKKKKPETQPSIDPNEVRIKGNQGHVKRYVDYACSLLEGKRLPDKRRQQERQQESTRVDVKPAVKEEDKPSDDKDKTDATDATDAPDDKDKVDDTKQDEKKQEDTSNVSNVREDKKPSDESLKFDTIVLKATGRAINKAVTTAEVVKRRIAGLHQVTSLETLEITDIWEPLEQGLKEVETKRRVASITITLSRDESAISLEAAGYQQPISSDAIKPFSMQNRNRRGGYRSGGGNYNRRGGWNRRGRGGYYNDNRNRGGYNRRGRGGYNRRGGGGYGGYNNRSPNRSPRGGGGYNRRGRGGGGRGRGRGGYDNRRNRGGYGGYDNRRRY
eukprot:28423_1